MTRSLVNTASAWSVAAKVVDPELPMLTLEDLGVLRDVSVQDGKVVVTITPTYTGCPAMATMRADLLVALKRAGFDRVEVRTTLSPAWSSQWITEHGRKALAAHGIAPPTGERTGGPISLKLTKPLRCPQCGATSTRELSRFGSTACKSLHVCASCGETFDHVKDI